MRKSRDASGDDQPEKRKKSSQETSESASEESLKKGRKNSRNLSCMYLQTNYFLIYVVWKVKESGNLPKAAMVDIFVFSYLISIPIFNPRHPF